MHKKGTECTDMRMMNQARERRYLMVQSSSSTPTLSAKASSLLEASSASSLYCYAMLPPTSAAPVRTKSYSVRQILLTY